MPFGLTNDPETFCNLMNDVLFDFLDLFVVGGLLGRHCDLQPDSKRSLGTP